MRHLLVDRLQAVVEALESLLPTSSGINEVVFAIFEV